MVTVLKGPEDGAKGWVETYKVPFPVYLDPQADLFKGLGLRRTAMGVLSMDAVFTYAEKLVNDETILPAYPGDDLYRLAGDFIVNSDAELVYSYHGKSYNDRPAVSELVDKLKALASR